MLCLRNSTWSRHFRRNLATVANGEGRRLPQTVIEKVVQKYAVGLPSGKSVKAGDYIMIRPEYVMTHDNTGPVISKYVAMPLSQDKRTQRFLDLILSVPLEYTTQGSPFLR